MFLASTSVLVCPRWWRRPISRSCTGAGTGCSSAASLRGITLSYPVEGWARRESRPQQELQAHLALAQLARAAPRSRSQRGSRALPRAPPRRACRVDAHRTAEAITRQDDRARRRSSRLNRCPPGRPSGINVTLSLSLESVGTFVRFSRCRSVALEHQLVVVGNLAVVEMPETVGLKLDRFRLHAPCSLESAIEGAKPCVVLMSAAGAASSKPGALVRPHRLPALGRPRFADNRLWLRPSPVDIGSEGR